MSLILIPEQKYFKLWNCLFNDRMQCHFVFVQLVGKKQTFQYIIRHKDKILFLFHLFFFGGGGARQQHMEVPRLRAESELQSLAYDTTIATPDPSHICNLDHSPQQHRILNSLSEARDQICILMDTSQIHFQIATVGTTSSSI